MLGDAKLQFLHAQLRFQLESSANFLSSPSYFSSFTSSPPSSHHRQSPFLSPFASPALDVPDSVCQIQPPFPTAHPTTRPLTMALADETNRIVSEFDFTDDDLNRHVKEFLSQMGMSVPIISLRHSSWDIPTAHSTIPRRPTS